MAAAYSSFAAARPQSSRASRLQNLSMHISLPTPIRPVSFAEMELDPEAATTPMTPSEDLTPTPRSCFLDLESEPGRAYAAGCSSGSPASRRGHDYFALLQSPCSPRTKMDPRSVPATAPLFGANAMLGPSGMMELDFQRRRSSSASDCSTSTVRAAGEAEDDFKAGLKLGWDIHPSHLGFGSGEAKVLAEKTNWIPGRLTHGVAALRPNPSAALGTAAAMGRQRSEQAHLDPSARRRLVPNGMVRQASQNSFSTGMSRTSSNSSNRTKRPRSESADLDVLSPPSPMGPFTPPQTLPFAMPAMSGKTAFAASLPITRSSVLAHSAPVPTSPIEARRLRGPLTHGKSSPIHSRFMSRSATFSAGTDMVRCISVPVATQAEFDAASLEHSLSRFTIDSSRDSVREEIKAGVLTYPDNVGSGTPGLSGSTDDGDLSRSRSGGGMGWKTQVDVPYPYNILGAAGEAFMSSPQTPERLTQKTQPVAGLGITSDDPLSSPPTQAERSPPTPSRRAFGRPGFSRAITFDNSAIAAAARRVEA